MKIDEGAHIPGYTVIRKDPAKDSRLYYISEQGVILVTAEMLQKKTGGERTFLQEPPRSIASPA